MEPAIHSSWKVKNSYSSVFRDQLQLCVIGKSSFFWKYQSSPPWFFRYDGKNFIRSRSTNYTHKDVIGLGNYRGQPFTTGGQGNADTEILTISTDRWFSGTNYPFSNRLNRTRVVYLILIYSVQYLLLFNSVCWWKGLHYRWFSFKYSKADCCI